MRKAMILVTALIAVLSLVALIAKLSAPTPPVQAATIPQPQLVPLIEFAQEAVKLSDPDISAARKNVIAALLTDIAKRTFLKRENQEFWIALVGVESRYQSKAKSHVGAIGLGQLMPQFKDDFAKVCELGEIRKEDLLDDYTNATLSACVFKHLIDTHQSITLAAVSYNSGSNSYSLRRAKSIEAPVHETAAYVTKIGVQRDLTKKNVKQDAQKHQPQGQ